MKRVCVIPAYNEEENIGEVVAAAGAHVDLVVVVDDGSDDRTADMAAGSGARVISHVINRGQGAALATGNDYALAAGADIIIHFDADGQFLAEEIADVILPVAAGRADIAVGSRFLDKSSDLPALKRLLIMPVARMVNRHLLGVRLSDPQGGFRVMAAGAARRIRIEQDGSAHCSEILYKATKLGLRLVEVPITVRYRKFGQGIFFGRGRGSGGARVLMDLIVSRLMRP